MQNKLFFCFFLLLATPLFITAQSRCSLEINDSPSIRGIKLGMSKAEVEAALGVKLFLTKGETFVKVTDSGRSDEDLSFLFKDPIARKMLLAYNHKFITYDEETLIRQIEDNSNLSRSNKDLQKSLTRYRFSRGEYKPELIVYVPDDLLFETLLSEQKIKRIKKLYDIKSIKFSFYNGVLTQFSINYDNKSFLPTSQKEVFESLNIPGDVVPTGPTLSCAGFKVNVSLVQMELTSDGYIIMSEGVVITIETSEKESLLISRAKQKLTESYKNAKEQENAGKKRFKP